MTAVISPSNPGFHTAACLSCHDGNQTQVVGMTGAGVESVDGVHTAPSRFFVRSWYDSAKPAGNSAAQFCRSCHYSKSNEYVGQTVPTT
ncbi:MAG: hypothetical protein LAN37_13170 [Acidobacteriia bacterium]|nr:hypothetical protein [Terriglobia bacterium]